MRLLFLQCSFTQATSWLAIVLCVNSLSVHTEKSEPFVTSSCCVEAAWLLFPCFVGCRVVFDNESDATSTLITVDSANKAGCLLQVVQLLTDLDLVISKAHISSDGGWFVDGASLPFPRLVLSSRLVPCRRLALGMSSASSKPSRF